MHDTGSGESRPAHCRARLVAQPDALRRRLLWWAECDCGWTSATDTDSGVVLDHATAHDGLSLSLIDRGFRIIGRGED